MKITICGSMAHIDDIKQAAGQLESLGYEVEIPDPREEVAYDTLPQDERAKLKDELIRQHFDKISQSDAIFVYNGDKRGVSGYIGGNTLMEMAFAFAQGIEIFQLQTATGVSYIDEILGMNPIVIHDDIAAIDTYFKALPKTYVSSKSPIKLRAVSRAMRKAGMRTQVLPLPAESSVNEQPQSIEETYEGAENRHNVLRSAAKGQDAAYLATVESGNHKAHPKHNHFSSTVVILEKVGGTQKVGVTLELEFPKEMTDKVPSVYTDLGVLVQQEYGSTRKDPFPFFTNGAIDRLKLVESAVYNVAVQLPIAN